MHISDLPVSNESLSWRVRVLTEFSVAPYTFVPLVWEVYGYRTKTTETFLHHLYRKVCARTGRSFSVVKHYWDTVFSVSIWRGNAVVIRNAQSFIPGVQAPDRSAAAFKTYAYRD